jgi:hypothetical protein
MLEEERQFYPLSLVGRDLFRSCLLFPFSFFLSSSPSIALYLESLRIIKLCVGSFVFLTWSKLLLVVVGDALVFDVVCPVSSSFIVVIISSFCALYL